MNYGLWIQYDGTRYEGWQRQNRTQQTIQGKIEAVLSRMFNEPIEIQGAGRTDAGVHAAGQVANFHTDKRAECSWIKQELNRYLPADIGILDVKVMNPRFHSRLSAKEKVYRYRIGTEKEKNVFSGRWIYGIYEPLDLEEMRRAARLLCGTHDYRSFCGNKKMKKSTVRTVFDIAVEKKDGELWLTFTGDGFLQQMVRILTGTLIEVGQGQRKADSMIQILEKKDRQYAGKTAPAQGLMMMEVRYAAAGLK